MIPILQFQHVSRFSPLACLSQESYSLCSRDIPIRVLQKPSYGTLHILSDISSLGEARCIG
jgi:hypothetical protein